VGLALGLGLGLGLGRVACGVLRVVCDVWCVTCGVWRLRISSSSSSVQPLRTSAAAAAGSGAACAVAAPWCVDIATSWERDAMRPKVVCRGMWRSGGGGCARRRCMACMPLESSALALRDLVSSDFRPGNRQSCNEKRTSCSSCNTTTKARVGSALGRVRVTF